MVAQDIAKLHGYGGKFLMVKNWSIYISQLTGTFIVIPTLKNKVFDRNHFSEYI